jgi:putative DNA primase/helicase
MPKPTEEQIRVYFESRFPKNRSTREERAVKCPFHDDRSASMSFNVAKGLWNCHAGCGSGGLVAFEMRWSKCDKETAIKRVFEACGAPVGAWQKPEAIYKYRDAEGCLLFEKVRYPEKKFVIRQSDGKQFQNKLGDVQKPLYNLPEVLIADEIFVCEGEKDCDNLTKAFPNGHHLAATTNFDGAGKWRPEYSVYFAGKRVVVLPDNDDKGKAHGTAVAASVHPYALGVKVVDLPGLPEKGDVSDFLSSHGFEDIVSLVNQQPRWAPVKGKSILVPAITLTSAQDEEIDWLIDGVIQRGANGVICADPKVGKSWGALDMCLSLSMGSEWLGFRVPRAVKVALVSREDAPGLTAWRMKHLFAHKERPLVFDGIEKNLFVNTRNQSKNLKIDNDEHLSELLKAMRDINPELAIFDVFNVLHSADENDQTQMRAILDRFSMIQHEIGCAVALVHHYNKGEHDSMTKRLRGSSSIAGWAEWLIGISNVTDEDHSVKRMEFELKAANSPAPVYYIIENNNGKPEKLKRVSAPVNGKGLKRVK